MMNNRSQSGWKQEPSGRSRIVDPKIYIGIVKNNQDNLKMGRLEVWIPEMGGDENDSSKWHIVNYASPFAGATNIESNVEDGQTMDGSQKTYGWWAVPPDLNNEVLCCFANGDASKGYWFACLWQQNMNHMVPGVASNSSYQEGSQGILPPVVEYNKFQSDQNFPYFAPPRPRFDPLHNGLTAQGLYSDFERGPSSASARRDIPSKAFGLLTPRSNQLYVDDDPNNEYIRLRTRSGVQVLIHETNGYVYINSGSGNSWIEVSDIGIDVYSKGSISLRTQLDLNIRADRDINIDAGRDFNVWAGNSVKIHADQDLNLHSLNADTRITSGVDLYLNATGMLAVDSKDYSQHASDSSNLLADNGLNLQAGSTMNVKAGDTLNQQASTLNSKGGSINRDGQISDNGGAASDAAPATIQSLVLARQPNRVSQTDVDHSSIKTPVTRMPTHEPWPGHPKSKDQEIPRGDLHNGVPVVVTNNPAKVPNAAATTTLSPTLNQKTGDGSTKYAPYDASKASGKVKVGNTKVPADVLAAIKKASDVTGVDYGYMMAMAQKESNFNPNAKAPTSSASGLYQFTDGTWNSMVSKYGSQYGITQDMKNDPEASAIMAGLYAKENASVIGKATGQDPTTLATSDPTALYMGHFLGGGGAAKVLANPDQPAVSLVGQAAANANRSIFYDPSGNPRTGQQVYDLFGKQIVPNSQYFASADITPSTG